MTRKRSTAFGRTSLMPVGYLALLVILYAAGEFLGATETAAGGVHALADPASTAVDLLKETNTLSGLWASALLTAGATLAVKGRNWNPKWSLWDDILIIVVLAAGVLTYYGVYGTYNELLSMAAQSSIALDNRQLDVWLSVQYYGALAGTTLLGLILVRLIAHKGFAPE